MVSEKIIKQNLKEAEEVQRLRVPVVYTTIKQEGEDEMQRPFQSLFFSGLAAGFAIYLSLIVMGIFREYLGKDNLFIHVGYSVGFLAVILGRLQLFTENTITPVIPLLSNWNLKTLNKMLRLWAIVLFANILGVLLLSIATYYTNMIPLNITKEIIEISKHYIERSALDFFLQGIPAGFIVASIVWMMPSARNGNEFWLIMLFTTIISLCGFTHVIAGSGEVFIALLDGKISLNFAVFSAIIPSLFGNIIGGAGLFTLLAHGQVKEEV